jgi:hypothetical protein
MRRTLASIAIASIATLAGHAQSPNPLTVRGRVVASETGDPLPHARVVLFNDAAPLAAVFTDLDGRFAMASLPAGRYRLSVTKPGYAATTVFRAADALSEGVDVRMPRSCAISGRVVDALGEPSIGVRVTVNLRGRGSEPGGFAVQKTTQTDDLGEYRLGGLAEGSVVVSVNLMQMDDQGSFAPTVRYYPGVTTLAAAEAITLRAGDQKSGVDFVGISSQPTQFTVANQIVQNPGLRLLLPTPQPGAPATGTGIIRGRVTRSDGVPLSQATVSTTVPTTTGPNRVRFEARSAATEDDGRFEISDLPAGSYLLIARKPGYTSVSYGQPSPDVSGEPIQLADGEARNRVDIILPRYSSVTGQIVDEFGDSVEGVQVGLAQIRFQAGRRRLVGASAPGQTTDDLGRYRIYGVPPGQYIVSAAAGQVTAFQPTPDLFGYAPTYFPGTPDPIEAQLVSVGISQDVVGVDLALAQVPTARITGRRLAANGDPFGGSLVLAPSQRSGAIVTPPTGARTYPDGRFEFPNVPPGEYVVQADSGKRDASVEGEFATQFVTVNGRDIADVLLQASIGSTIRGHVTSVTDSPPANRLAIVAARADPDRTPLQNGSIARGDVQPDLTFQLSGIHGPRRLTLEQPPAGWALKTVLVNGLDVTDTPLPFGSKEQSLSDVEIVMTNRVTELTGVVLDARSNPVADYVLLAFSSDPERWYSGSRYLRRSAPDAAGAFRLRGLPPGDYFVAAVARPRATADPDGDDSWQDPEWLESMAPRAARVTLAEDQKVSVNPHLIVR